MTCRTCGSEQALLKDRQVWLPFPGHLAMCSHRWQEVGLEFWRAREQETRDCIRDICPRCAADERVHAFIFRPEDSGDVFDLHGEVHHGPLGTNERDHVIALAIASRAHHRQCEPCPAAAMHQRRLLLSLLTEFYPPAQARQWIEASRPELAGETARERIVAGRWPSVFALIDQLGGVAIR